MSIPKSFHDRRGLPGRYFRKLPERRFNWRTREIFVNPLSTALWNELKLISVQREALEKLVKNGCDRELILGIAHMLAVPAKHWKSQLPKPSVVEAAWGPLLELARLIRRETAFHALDLYDQRDWWLIQNLPELLEEYSISAKKIRRVSVHLERDFFLVWLADHVKSCSGGFEWATVAEIIDAWAHSFGSQKTVDSRSLERQYFRAKKRFRNASPNPRTIRD